MYLFFIKRAPRTVPRHAGILLGVNEDPVLLSYRRPVSITVQLGIDRATGSAPTEIQPDHRTDLYCLLSILQRASREVKSGLLVQSMALHQHCSLYTFLIWASHGAGDLSLRPNLPLGLGFRDPQRLQLQGH